MGLRSRSDHFGKKPLSSPLFNAENRLNAAQWRKNHPCPISDSRKNGQIISAGSHFSCLSALMFHKGTKILSTFRYGTNLTAFYFAPAQPESLHRRATLRRPPLPYGINNEKLINSVEDVLSEQLIGSAKAHPELTLHQTRSMSPALMHRSPAKWRCSPAAAADTNRCTAATSAGHALRRLSGEIFTSPTPDKMFECAMQIDGGEGVLLIIKTIPATS